jgi:hypothetical protein
MPIREFKCELGHITEKILQGEEDHNTKMVLCEYSGITELCGPGCELASEQHKCYLEATRVDLPSSSSFRLSPGGSGGFYKPSVS